MTKLLLVSCVTMLLASLFMPISKGELWVETYPLDTQVYPRLLSVPQCGTSDFVLRVWVYDDYTPIENARVRLLHQPECTCDDYNDIAWTDDFGEAEIALDFGGYSTLLGGIFVRAPGDTERCLKTFSCVVSPDGAEYYADCKVELNEFGGFAAGYGSCTGGDPGHAFNRCEFDGFGCISLPDFDIIAAVYGDECSCK